MEGVDENQQSDKFAEKLQRKEILLLRLFGSKFSASHKFEIYYVNNRNKAPKLQFYVLTDKFQVADSIPERQIQTLLNSVNQKLRAAHKPGGFYVKDGTFFYKLALQLPKLLQNDIQPNLKRVGVSQAIQNVFWSNLADADLAFKDHGGKIIKFLVTKSMEEQMMANYLNVGMQLEEMAWCKILEQRVPANFSNVRVCRVELEDSVLIENLVVCSAGDAATTVAAGRVVVTSSSLILTLTPVDSSKPMFKDALLYAAQPKEKKEPASPTETWEKLTFRFLTNALQRINAFAPAMIQSPGVDTIAPGPNWDAETDFLCNASTDILGHFILFKIQPTTREISISRTDFSLVSPQEISEDESTTFFASLSDSLGRAGYVLTETPLNRLVCTMFGGPKLLPYHITSFIKRVSDFEADDDILRHDDIQCSVSEALTQFRQSRTPSTDWLSYIPKGYLLEYYKFVTPLDSEELKQIGHGGSSVIYRNELCLAPGQIKNVVLKVPTGKKRSTAMAFIQECCTLKQFSGPGVVECYGMAIVNDMPALVLEYCPGGSLFSWIHRRRKQSIPIHGKLSIARQIAKALQRLHQANTSHFDLKPQNILVAADGSVKLSDFGLARAEYRSVDGYTVNFSSPEQLRQRNVGTSSDIWAFGMLLYSLFSEALPFTSLMNRFPGTKIPKSVMLDELSNNLDGFQHDLGELASCLDREIVETIQSCLSLEPLQRPTIDSLLVRLENFE